MNYIKEDKFEQISKIEKRLISFLPNKMDLPSQISGQMAFNTGSKIEEHTLIVLNKSTHEERLSQPLRTIKKPFKTIFTFLTGSKGIFNVTYKNNKI